MMRHLLSLLFVLCPFLLIGQGTALPLGNYAYPIMDRLEIKTGLLTPYHSTLKYYLREDITRYAMQIDTALISLTAKDRRDLYYIFKDNNDCLGLSGAATTLTGPNEPIYQKRYVDSTATFYTVEEKNRTDANQASDFYILRDKPILKHFYKSPANLFELNYPDFYLRINPIINFGMSTASAEPEALFNNQRGVELRGGVDDRIFFYTNILESQSRFPDYVNKYIEQNRAVPGAGLYKPYQSDVFNVDNGYDYLLAQGYIGFNVTRHVGVQFGHGRNFIGQGYRSMLLSDFATDYLYLKINTRVWKLHYQNIFAELNAFGTRDESRVVIPKKYLSAHYLSYRPTPNFSVGFYEAVLYSRERQLELQYLNPVIFYRTIEQGLASPDNVLIGLDFKWNLFKKVQLYGQLMLDEFKFDELILERRGWWGNKFGVQAGAKYIDLFGIDHLDVRLEWNMARPYTYTHFDSTANYTHTNQALAHPLGANFQEVLGTLRYQATKKLLLEARLIAATTGEDEEGTNWGIDLLRDYDSRELEIGNEIGQGVGAQMLLAGLDVTYQLYHNIFIDLNVMYRRFDSDLDARDVNSRYIGAGIRMNIGRQRFDF